MQLYNDIVPTQVSKTPTTSTWSTIVCRKTKEDQSSTSTKSVTFGDKMVHEDSKVPSTLPSGSQQPNITIIKLPNNSSTDSNNQANADFIQDYQIGYHTKPSKTVDLNIREDSNEVESNKNVQTEHYRTENNNTEIIIPKE